MGSRFRHFWIGAAVVVALAGAFPQVTPGEEPLRPDLSPLIRRVLAWLPETTETIVVGQSFTFPHPQIAGAVEPTLNQSKESFPTIVQRIALGALTEPEMEPYLKPLAEKRVLVAVRGGRNYEWVSASLPAYRTEGCTVVMFDEDLGKVGLEWVNTLRAGAKDVRMIAGRTVFVFPPTKSMRPARDSKWPGKLGVYLALLKSDTILCATSDKYLEELLERIDTPADNRALPDQLREWKYVNPAADAWMLRHNVIPKDAPRVIEGATWTMTKERFKAVYVTVPGAEENAAHLVQEVWKPALPEVRPTIERLKDGSIAVSSTVDTSGADFLFGLGMMIYWLEADSVDRRTD